MWSNNLPSENGHYWYVQEHYVNDKLKNRYGPSLGHVRIEEDEIDGGCNIWIDMIGTDDGDYMKFKSDEMVTKRLVPREAIFGWDSDEIALKKARDIVTRKWVYWLKPIITPEFDQSNKAVDPYPVLHQKGVLSVESLLTVGGRHCDVGIQIARDGRIWLCVDGQAFIRFKPISEKHMETLFGKEITDETN